MSAGLIFAAACAGPAAPSGASDGLTDGGTPPGLDAAGSSQKPWAAALSELAAGAAAVYSFSFEGAPPAGSRFRFGLHLTDRAHACARYGSSSTSTPERDFWYMEVNVNRAEAGAYAVTTDRLSSRPDRAGTVTLLHRRDGDFVERYPALSGTVSFMAAPRIEDFEAGSALRATFDLSFAAHAVQALECRGGQGSAAPAGPTVCACLDDEGRHGDCTLQPGQEQCCFDGATERLPFHAQVDAGPCASMCRSLAGLPDYCGALEQR